MSTAHEIIYAALVAAGTDAGGRWFPIVNNSNPLVMPFGTYQRISQTPENYMAGAPALANARFQVDVFADSEADAQSLAVQVKAAMATLSLTLRNGLLLEADAYESEVKLYRVSLHFSVWS